MPLYTGHVNQNFMMVTLADRVSKWSCPFNIDQIDDIHLKLIYSDGHTVCAVLCAPSPLRPLP